MAKSGEDLCFFQAAVLVQDALLHRKLKHKIDAASLRLYEVLQSPAYIWTLRGVVYANLLLAFFETPGASVSTPIAVPLSLEFVFLLAYVADLFMRWRVLEPGKFWRDIKNTVQLSVVGLTVADMIVYAICYAHGVRYPRFTRLLRVFFVTYFHRAVRMSFRDIRRALPQILDVFVLLIAILLFAAGFMMIFFYQDPGEEPFFYDFGQSFTSVYVLMTTENFPAIMIPSYSDNRWNVIPFVVFLFVSHHLMINIVLAMIYSTYRDNFKDEVLSRIRLERRTMARAWQTACGPSIDNMPLHVWTKLFAVLRPTYPPDKVRLLFEIIDEDGDGTITMIEFHRVVDLLDMQIRRWDAYQNMWARMLPSFYNLPAVQLVRRVVLHRLFSYMTDLVIIANLVTVLLLFGQLNAEQAELANPNAFYKHTHIAEMFFFALYMLELVLKLFAMGPKKYWKHAWNKFDSVVLPAILISFILAANGVDRKVVRVVMFLRVIRVFRLFSKFKRYATIIKTIGTLWNVLVSNTAMMLVVYYVFTIIGVECWSGDIYRGNPVLIGTDYAATNYFPNSFNTFGEGLVMMFTLTIVNDWQVTVSAFAAISGRWVWAFFIAAHICCVILIENVFIAFVIELFSLNLGIERDPPVDPIQERVDALSTTGNSGTCRAMAEWRVKQRKTTRHTMRTMFAGEIAEMERIENSGAKPPEKRCSIRRDSTQQPIYLAHDLSVLFGGIGWKTRKLKDSGGSGSQSPTVRASDINLSVQRQSPQQFPQPGRPPSHAGQQSAAANNPLYNSQ